MKAYLSWNDLNGTEVVGDHFINKAGHLAEVTWVAPNREAWSYRILRRDVGNPSTSKCSNRVCNLKAEDNVRLAVALSKVR